MTNDAPRPIYPPFLRLPAVRGTVDATVAVPGSKSITNRALLLAALARGSSTLRGALASDDTERMIEALTALGARVEPLGGSDLAVHGIGGALQTPEETLFIGNSGTSVRFLTAACVHLERGASCVLDGIARMRQRPIQDLIDALAPLGGRVDSTHGTGCPPVRVYGGGLRGGETTVNGAISSQYLSALMMTAPLAGRDVTIRVAGALVSKPYVEMTAEVMRSFGARIDVLPEAQIWIPAPQAYEGREFAIEPDASNASYFLAAAAVTGGAVTVQGLGAGSMQGDARFARILEAMGCRVAYGETSIRVAGPKALAPVDVDLSAMPDMAQTLAVCCLFAGGVSTIRGIHTLADKETDRIVAIANELRKLGAAVDYDRDFWRIGPPEVSAIAPVAIDTYDDHRMAMSFAVAGLRVDRLIVNEPGCVAKTFPDFWQRWEAAFYSNA